MNALAWVISIVIAGLAALNAIAWGYATKEVGDPQLTLSFLLRLIFNKWFITAMVSAFLAALLSYVVLREMGILAGRFFLSLQTIAIIIVGIFVLDEKPTIWQWIGIALILMGVVLVGKW